MSAARAAIWLLSAGALLAADQPTAATPAAPPAEDSIAAAKRDLETIKAARGTPEPARAGLPPFSTPEFSLGTPVPPRNSAPKTPAEAAALKKSENWLVDAMMKRPVRSSEAKERSPENVTASDEQARTDESPPADHTLRNPRKSDRPEPRDRSDAVANPLTDFMAGWMTPQDFKLLQPTWGREGDSATGGRDEFAAPLPPSATGSTADRLPLGKSPGETASRTARENPFLTAFGPTNSASGPPPPAIVAPAPSGKSPADAAPPPPVATAAPANPARPAFVKPPDDAKYFKPLKKF